MRKSKIIEMINTRTGEPGLTNLKERLKLENDEVSQHELNKLKARISSEMIEDGTREVRPKVNRVFNSITQTLLRSV